MSLFLSIWIVFDSSDSDRPTAIGLGIENQMNTYGRSDFISNEHRIARADIIRSPRDPKKGTDEDIRRVELEFEKHDGQMTVENSNWRAYTREGI
jgi:hypothetical protein